MLEEHEEQVQFITTDLCSYEKKNYESKIIINKIRFKVFFFSIFWHGFLKKLKCCGGIKKLQIRFIIIILLATSAQPWHSISHVEFSVSGLTARTKIESIFFFLGMTIGTKSILGPKCELAQNVGIKSAFTSIN